MSWEVGDDEWLAEPAAVPGSGPVDAVDDRVLRALSQSPAQPAEPVAEHAPVAEHTPVDGYPLTSGDLPPPPHSAAFDASLETPSYESGSFVAEPEDQAEPHASDEGEGEPEFHIPTLSLGLTASANVETQAPEPEPSRESGLDISLVDPTPEPEPASFVIPNLSVSAQPESAAPAVTDDPDEALEEVEVEEVEEIEEVDEPDEPPIRTGDTVITRAPGPESNQDLAAAAPSITDSVYDDDDDDEGPALVIPELVSSPTPELEVELEPPSTVDYPPAEPDADTVVEPSPTPSHDSNTASGEFVIPTLARPEPTAEEPALAPAEPSDGGAGSDAVVIPSLLANAPDEAELQVEEIETVESEAEDAVAEVVDEPDEDEFQEVDAEAIESLDSADLEEVEQPVVVGGAVEVPPDAKPPAPPEVKQAKRRKAWYDDVFAEHFLFLYPLTWDETCQRDAQFIFSSLGAREGMSVLDIGCGDGRHAVELAKLGAQVTGLDNSLALLLAAAQSKESAELEDGHVQFIHGDMRRLPRDREFDAVMCVGTTLGYFEEEQNWLCLQEMHDRLKPGGRLLIHVFNRDFVAPHLPSRSWWQGKRCMVIDEAEMNFFANRLRVHRTIIFDDGRQYEHYMFMRAYTVQDLGKAISQLGMRVLEVSGSRDTRGRFYGSASPDIWIVAEKK